MSAKVVQLNETSNAAEEIIASGRPYRALARVVGSADILFHRWNVDGVEAKAKAAKGSKAKKTDDIESYVYRDDAGVICIPGEYFRQALLKAAKYRQDPRSPRKSAMDLFKAGIVNLTPLASLGVGQWDYEHRARVQVQRNGITRTRPALKAGWRCEVEFLVVLPEYINPQLLHETLMDAGRLEGVGDFRPTYGRFLIQQFGLQTEE